MWVGVHIDADIIFDSDKDANTNLNPYPHRDGDCNCNCNCNASISKRMATSHTQWRSGISAAPCVKHDVSVGP